ncbi:MAG: DNA polymerase III subunit beta [Ruminococcus sp.]
MKIKFNKREMTSALSVLLRAVNEKSTLPVLGGILIVAENDTLTLSAYNLEVGIRTVVSADVSESGSIVLSASIFMQMVKNAPDELVQITCDETDSKHIAYIKSGRSKHKVVGVPAKDFPDFPKEKETDRVTVNSEVLFNMIKSTLYATSKNNSKAVYTGSLFEIKDGVLTVVALDGYRMSLRTAPIKGQKDNTFIIPAQAQAELLKVIDTVNKVNDEEESGNVDIIVGTRHAMFTYGNYLISTCLLEGCFANYESLINMKDYGKFTVNADKLFSAVNRVNIVDTKKVISPIRLTIDKDEIRLLCKSSLGESEDTVEIESYDKKPFEIGFNATYLLEGLRVSDEDDNGNITIYVKSPESPIAIMGDNNGLTYTNLVVPMRIK